jgi:hypothetical protein
MVIVQQLMVQAAYMGFRDGLSGLLTTSVFAGMAIQRIGKRPGNVTVIRFQPLA